MSSKAFDLLSPLKYVLIWMNGTYGTPKKSLHELVAVLVASFHIVWKGEIIWHFPDAFGSFYFFLKAGLRLYPTDDCQMKLWLGMVFFFRLQY